MENTSAPLTVTRAAPSEQTSTRRPRLWHVVLLDDEEHTYDYVIDMMRRIFAHPPEKALRIAKTVDKEGRAVCVTTHRELAELKLEQVHTFGADRLIAGCKGSMSAVLEPATSDDDHRGTEDGRRQGGSA